MRSTVFSRDVHRSVSFTKVRRGPSSLLSPFLRFRLLVELPALSDGRASRVRGPSEEYSAKSWRSSAAAVTRSNRILTHGAPLPPFPYCLVNNHRSHPAGGIKGGYLRLVGA